MSIYFCLEHLIQVTTSSVTGPDPMDRLVIVSTAEPACDGHREDALILSSQPRILNMNEASGAYKLAALIEDVPLYQINLELLIDRALAERHHNKMIERALGAAFDGQALPNTLQSASGDDEPIALEGSLRHPMIGHLDRQTLAKIYMNFYRALPHGHEDFDFERFILGHHPEPFRAQFDGFLIGPGGQVCAGLLIGFGIREDYDPRRAPDSYIDGGQKKAAAMRLSDARELAWAWLEADQYQMRRCRDIDRVRQIGRVPKQPNWIRTDMFNCLEREAMKQVFATSMVQSDPGLSLLADAPNLRKSIENNARDGVDDLLQKLLSETLNPTAGNTGAAGKFQEQAQIRAMEGKRL